MGKQSLTNENPSSKDAAPVKKGTKTKLRIKADDKHAVKKKTPSIHDLFQFQHLLGEGAFGKVYQAVRRRDNVVVALKVVPNPESNSGNQDLEREIQALESLSSPGHPHVCRLLDHHQDNSHCYLAMESIGGGELFEHLCSGGAFSEQDASKFLKQMVDGLHYIHQKGYVHADLKPENLMMGSIQKDQAQVKIVDFGFSVPIETQPLVFGTLAYLPPEFVPQFPKPQTPTYAVDMYAVGVILYTVLTGSHPFDPTNQAPDEVIARHAYQTSVDGNYLDNYVFDERTNGLSSSSMILLRSLLHPDPKQRMTSAKLCAHSWILGKTASGKPLQSHTKLKSFWQKRFRKYIF